MMIGRVPIGIAQLLIWLVGVMLIFTVIGALIGFPMMLGAWIWGLMVAVDDSQQSPVVVNVINASAQSAEASPAKIETSS